MVYHFSDLFTWTSGKPIILTEGRIPVYGSNGVIGYTCYSSHKNRIILGRVGAYCGSVAYCPTEFSATDNTLITECDTRKILYRYAYYLLIKFNLNKFAGGAAQPVITQGLLKHLKCDIPAVCQQQRVVDTLSPYDDLIGINNKRMIANILSGGTPSTEHEEYYGGDIPFFTPKDSTDNFYVFDTLTKITKSGLNRCNSPLYPKNTIMITARGTVGNLNLLAIPMAMNQSCYAINSDIIHSQYFLFFLIRREVQKLRKMASGGVFDTIIINTFDHIKVCLPDEEIIAKFDTIVTAIMDEMYLLSAQSRILTEQRDSLLPRLMSGKLEV